MDYEAAALEEIVVMGQASVRKNSAVGSVSVIKGYGQDYPSFVPNVEQLQGRMAGVHITPSYNKRKIKRENYDSNIHYKNEDNEEYKGLIENAFIEVKKTR